MSTETPFADARGRYLPPMHPLHRVGRIILPLLVAALACDEERDVSIEGTPCVNPGDELACGDDGVRFCTLEVTGVDPLWGPCRLDGVACESDGAITPCGADLASFRVCHDPGNGDLVWSACLDEPCDVERANHPCETLSGDAGEITCFRLYSMSTGTVESRLVWGLCAVPECTLGTSECSPCRTCESETLTGVARWESDCTCNHDGTPLVLAFDDAPPTFATLASAAPFDISGAGLCEHPSWPSAATPWLVRDLDRSGGIDGGAELFGSGTRLQSGGLATHGFEALAELDGDGDGRITPEDAAWTELLLWSDVDGDRRSSGWELASLDAFGVDALDLAFHVDPICDALGNCGRERAPFSFHRDGRSAQGEVIDVHLVCE